jgi:hypothetical protein
MSDKSQELLLGLSAEPPEMDSDQDEVDDILDHASLVSSERDILDHMGKEDFELIWAVQFEFIRNQPLEEHIRFAESLLEKVFELYDYQFPEKVYIFTKKDVEEVYSFIKFLEYKNSDFLSVICRVLGFDVIKENIENYCKVNTMRIIKEVEEQSSTYYSNQLISIFLRTYIKDDFIKWFSKQIKKSKMEIAEKIYEE